MALTTEIITATEVKQLAMPTVNFDESLLERFILPCQRYWIKPLLGLDYYNQILTEVENTATVTAEDTTLIEDYIKPALAYYVLYDAFPQIRVDITSKGIMIGNSETSTPASARDSEFTRRGVLSMAEKWVKALKDFIAETRDSNSSAYPLYGEESKETGNKYFL